MNGKELNNFAGRRLKVDFDTKQKAKSSYKTNMNDDGNTRFNKQIKKDEILERLKKAEFIANIEDDH